MANREPSLGGGKSCSSLSCVEDISKNGWANEIADIIEEEKNEDFQMIDEKEGANLESEVKNSSDNNSDLNMEFFSVDFNETPNELPGKTMVSGEEYTVKQNVILEEKDKDHFEQILEGWIQITHSSGRPVYLHRESRICTMAKPYYLGLDSAINHKIPLTAISCFHCKQTLETEEKNKHENPKYELIKLDCPPNHISATFLIDGVKYSEDSPIPGKKETKVEAAKSALETHVPQQPPRAGRDVPFGIKSELEEISSKNSDLSIFYRTKIEDVRVSELSTQFAKPKPSVILVNCLKRNMISDRIQIKFEKNDLKDKYCHNKFTMKVGDHEAIVRCNNKQEGKQMAAQIILQMMHPNVSYWGSLLKIYDNQAIKREKEKKEQELKDLKNNSTITKPNSAVLNKLREEMLKLSAKRDVMKSKVKDGFCQCKCTCNLPSLPQFMRNTFTLSSGNNN